MSKLRILVGNSHRSFDASDAGQPQINFNGCKDTKGLFGLARSTTDLANFPTLVDEGISLQICGAVLSEAVRAARVNGGGVFPPALSNQLVETMAEVLNLTGAQDTPHPHQVSVGSPAAAVGMATTP